MRAAPERDELRAGDATIAFRVTRSKRRRRTIEIRLDPREGVLVAAPLRASAEDVRAAVRARAAWIARQASCMPTPPAPNAYVSGESLPYLGRQTPLVAVTADRRRVAVKLDGDAIHIASPLHLSGEERRSVVEAAVVRWYRRQAAALLTARCERWADAVGVAPPKAIFVRDQRLRWGSCSADGVLRFNWRLALASLPLIDYVVVHELAHLRVRNHSAEFWSVVAAALPGYASTRRLLREIGHTLVL